MALHRISKGLDLPLAGAPNIDRVDDAAPPSRVALIAADYPGLKPTMFVKEGDQVARGQALCEDKKTPGVRFTAPAAGTVTAINRGARRALVSIVIETSEGERSGAPETTTFESYRDWSTLEACSADEVRALLLESGTWTAIRRRPFGKVADPSASAGALFVTAMDSNPHAPPVLSTLEGREVDFEAGVLVLSRLVPRTFVCTAPEVRVALPDDETITHETFSGPHPAGNAGTHIHTLYPVGQGRCAWHVGYQDVLMIGRLFRTGELDVSRTVSLAGPAVTTPRLLKTQLGASLDELTAGELADGENRVISGSVLAGRAAAGDETGFLGRYDNQISALAEERDRHFIGWMLPGANKFSIASVFLSAFLPKKQYAMTTTTHGSKRAIVPIGSYERVMPGDFLPTFLLRSLCVHDVERAEELGALELVEEDLALCTFVCAGKIDYGTKLRETLDIIEKEG